MNTSLLMKDSSEKGGHIETMLDYILSWTIRRASVIYATEKPQLYKYCREILFNLLGIKDYEHIKVQSVETWKQWNYIDLHANVELEYDGQTEHHAILIENKAYTSVHDNQLMRYKQIFEETYSNTPFQAYLNFVLVTCFDNPPECLIQACKESDFRCLPLLDLFSNEQKEESESDLFNEFWLRQW